MKKVICSVLVVAAISLLPTLALADTNYYRIAVKCYCPGDKGAEKCAVLNGSYRAEEGEYGHIGITLALGGENSSVQVVGTAGYPVTRLLRGDEPPALASDIDLAADLYLKASPSGDNWTHVDGYLTRLSHPPGKDRNLFDYNEEKLDFGLGWDSVKTIPLIKIDNKEFLLDITAMPGDSQWKTSEAVRSFASSLSIDSRYGLFNVDRKEYEMTSTGSYTPGVDGQAYSQSAGKRFPLPSGDTLLYMCLYSLSRPTLSGSNAVDFQLSVMRIFAINPVFQGFAMDSIKSEKTSGVVFNKDIHAIFGRGVEIQIPPEVSGRLPFNSTEVIYLVANRNE